MENKTKVIAAIAVGSLVALGGVAVHDITEAPLIEQVNQTVIEYVNVTEEVIVEKIVEVPYNVTVVEEIIVEDEAFKAMACDRLMYDDISECVEEVEAESVALELAIAEIRAEAADEIEDANLVDDEEDVRLITIYSDFEDINVVRSNFDNERYVFEIEAKIEDEDTEDKTKVMFKVRVEDSEAEIISVN